MCFFKGEIQYKDFSAQFCGSTVQVLFNSPLLRARIIKTDGANEGL